MSQGHDDSRHGWQPPHEQGPPDEGERDAQQPGKRRKGVLIGLLAGGGVLALLVVIALVVVAPGGGNGKSEEKTRKKPPKAPAAAYEVAWRTPKPSQLDAVKPVDVFVVGDTVVRVDIYSITAYDIADGEQRWQVTIPEDRHLCAVSPRAAGGIIAYGIGTSAGSCPELQAIDASDGTTLWGTELEPQQDESTLIKSIAVLKRKVVVATAEGVRALDAKSGGERWRIAPDNPDCQPGEVQATTKRLLGIVDCAEKETSDSADLVVSIDPDTGETNWLDKLPNKGNYAPPQIFQASPPVLMINDQRDKFKFQIVDEKDGEQLAEFRATGDGGTLDPDEYQLGNVDKALTINTPFVVAGDTLIGMAKVADQESPLGSRVVLGISLETGERLWSTDLGKIKDGRDFHGRMVFSDEPDGPARVYITRPGSWGYTKLTTVDPETGELAEGTYVADHPETIASSVFLSSGKTLIEVSTTSITPYAIRAYTPKKEQQGTATPK